MLAEQPAEARCVLNTRFTPSAEWLESLPSGFTCACVAHRLSFSLSSLYPLRSFLSSPDSLRHKRKGKKSVYIVWIIEYYTNVITVD